MQRLQGLSGGGELYEELKLLEHRELRGDELQDEVGGIGKGRLVNQGKAFCIYLGNSNTFKGLFVVEVVR